MPTDAIIEFVKQYGKPYKSALYPKDLPRGKVGDCFDTSIKIALDHDLRYVEGIAENPKNYGEWIYHAWVTDGIHAFDPTWISWSNYKKNIPVIIPVRYIGIEMDTKHVAAFMLKTKHKAVIGNCDMSPELAKICVPQISPELYNSTNE